MGQINTKIHGTVAPGYESVKDMFTDNFRAGREENAQLCVYVGDELVVDLWASQDSSSQYDADSLTNVFSSTKSLTAIAMAMLVEKGLLDYNKNISDYWPEFGQNDKQETTVADLMRHEAGLARFDTSIQPDNTLRENIKSNKIGQLIEEQSPDFPEGRRRAYHAVTRGWIANEIFRRSSPSGSTIGEFWESLEVKGIHIGVPDNKLDKCQPHKKMSSLFILFQSLIPSWIGRAIDPNIFQLVQLVLHFRKVVSGTTLHGKKPPPALVGLELDSELFNSPTVRQGETPSANGNCSARGLARVAATMANEGGHGGLEILGKKGWESLHANPTDEILIATNVKFTQGGVAKFTKDETNHEGREGYYGWLGIGGSVMQWHPELRIGFAYVPSLLTWIDPINNKARSLQMEVKKCAEKMK